jgi:hypothetical protein
VAVSSSFLAKSSSLTIRRASSAALMRVMSWIMPTRCVTSPEGPLSGTFVVASTCRRPEAPMSDSSSIVTRLPVANISMSFSRKKSASAGGKMS